jgi:phenylacetate-CoA ligase
VNAALLQVYHHLPSWARTVVATGRGAYLHYWRYDRTAEALVNEALERERWSPQQWKSWQEEHLAYVLHRAATKVPYYRAAWEKRRQAGSRASWQYLENWEILDKEAVRANTRSFIADDCQTWRMFPEHTNGTTGKPLTLLRTREVQRAWYALVEARARHWHGISRHDRWAILGGQSVIPASSRTPPFWVWNAALNQLYLSSYHLAPDLVPYYLDALKKYNVQYLLGFTASLYVLAQQVLRAGRTDLKMRVVLTNAEPLTHVQREVISQAFQCPVRETYGSAEIVAAGSECTYQRLHLWPEVGIVEVMDGGRAAAPGTPGELICTGLLNADMPLIRYRIGDRAALEPESAAVECSCGRTLPRIASLEGRVDDVVHTRDGRKISCIDAVFSEHMPIQEAQIIQDSLDLIRVRYVPAQGFSARTSEEIVRAIQEHLGAVQVILEPVDQIAREPNGKFRAVICRIPVQEQTKTGTVEHATLQSANRSLR